MKTSNLFLLAFFFLKISSNIAFEQHFIDELPPQFFDDDPTLIEVKRTLAFREFASIMENLNSRKHGSNPKNCADLYKAGFLNSSIYKINLRLHPRVPTVTQTLNVYCDMETDGGGWTVIQRRGDYMPHENFNRSWEEYSKGFGNLSEAFWLGNENIHLLLSVEETDLLIEMGDFKGRSAFLLYKKFLLGDEISNYRLIASFNKSSSKDITSYFTPYTDDMEFLTYDHGKCTQRIHNGWWYSSESDCSTNSNLNGIYMRKETDNSGQGIHWQGWTKRNATLKWTEMKIRPATF